MATGKAAVSFEYHSWITPRQLVSHWVAQSVALKVGQGEQLQATLFWQVALWFNHNFFFFTPVNKLWKIICCEN